ncbi:serine/threonine-protein kinase MRCK alpha-like [Dysidea avara]|uniref:serine/threonine-protein kinase MRCK alpha-like n=1 Tax=Dysidea avara TaxID=196820 RepID=UPI0033328B05
MDVSSRYGALDAVFLRRGNQQDARDAYYSVETLLDSLMVLYQECCSSSMRRERNIAEFVESAKPLISRLTDMRLRADDFETLNIIGRGAFGEVLVVKQKDTGKVYAMKVLNKAEMLKKQKTACFREERDVLVFGNKDWITTLYYAFQDTENLYLVMDYYSGGDLLTLISKYEDHLSEDMARFYAAEMILAIDSLHQLGYVHRDIKPDNVLIDSNGHIRLGDFGSCLKMDANGKISSNVAVGTPDYISPEILQAMEDGRGSYGKECDWWSLGVCLYELLYGETPFYAESLLETYGKIMQHKTGFSFPEDEDDLEVSKEAKDLIQRLICDGKKRLGRNGIDDFKKHPFFKGIDWDKIRNTPAPYTPEIASEADTSNFEEFDPKPSENNAAGPVNSSALAVHLPFVGFTYTHNSLMSDNPPPQDDATDASGPVITTENRRLKEQIGKLEVEVKKLKNQPRPKSTVNDDESFAAERESLQNKLRTLERASRQAKTEKTQLQEEVTKTQQQSEQLQQEIKNLKSSLRDAQSDVTMLTNKLSDLRQQKNHLEHEKDEEIGTLLKRLDLLRKEAREMDRQKRNFAAELEEVNHDLQRQKRLVQRSELANQQLKEELEMTAKSSQKNSQAAAKATNHQQEINKLEQRLKEVEIDHQEAITAMQSKQDTEMIRLKGLLANSETVQTELQREVKDLQSKLQQLRRSTELDLEESLRDHTLRFDREKQKLKQDNQDLQAEVGKAKTNLEQALASKAEMEAMVTQKQDLLSQWESQIADIIQWVSDEKSARTYLNTIATRLKDDVDTLKGNFNMLNRREESWRTLRSNKREKMELLEKQLELNNEIRAKEEIQRECTTTRQQLTETETNLAISESKYDQLEKEVEILKQELLQARQAAQLTESQTNLLQQQQQQQQRDMAANQNKLTGGGKHDFVVRSFDVPTKCDHCSSIMIGLVRQGMICKTCSCSCHFRCADKLPNCPIPPSHAASVGLDGYHGVGTALEGWVRIPKPGGVRKGWMKQYAIICDFKLFVHNIQADTPNMTVTHLFDIKDDKFSVMRVTKQDVIHASPKHVPCIFKVQVGVTMQQLGSELLILMETQADQEKWVAMLEELSKVAKSKQQSPQIFTPRVICERPADKDGLRFSCATVLDTNRILLGGEEGLLLFDCTEETLQKLGERKVTYLERCEQLIVFMGQRNRCPCFSHIGTLGPKADIDASSVKIADARSCQLVTIGTISNMLCLCTTNKKKVAVFEINPKKLQYGRIKEFSAPQTIQWVRIVGGKVCIGFVSGFMLFSLQGDVMPQKLVHPDDLSLGFIRVNELNTLGCVELNGGKEYLLCFHVLAMYVDSSGRRSRKEELIWHSNPSDIVYSEPYLLVYSECCVEVYHVPSAHWMQNVPLRKVKNLNKSGNLLQLLEGAFSFVYLRKHGTEDELMQMKRGRTRTTTKLAGMRPLISGPIDFRHEQHIGVDWMGSGSPSEQSTGMVTSHSMQAGLNQAGGDMHPLMKTTQSIHMNMAGSGSEATNNGSH